MKRRMFLRQLGLGTATVAATGLPRQSYAAPKKLRWRMAMAVPKTMPIWGPGMERFAKKVETLTGGGLKIRVYGAGELVPALGTFEAVKKGEIQLGHSAAYYWLGKIPAAPFFTGIPFGMDLICFQAWMKAGGGNALYEELMKPHGVHCIQCGGVPPQMGGWFRKEISSPESLKGLKIRIPGLAARAYSKLGAKPVLIPGGEIFTSLSTGVIDAAEWIGPYHDYTMGFHRAAKYYYGGAWAEPGGLLELMINGKAWAGLPKEYQLALELASDETTQWMIAQFEKENQIYLKKIKADKNIIVQKFPDSVLDAFKKESKGVVAEMANSSPLAKKIWASYNAFHMAYKEYQDLTVVA